MTGSSAPLVEIHRARSYAEGMGRCSDMAVGGAQVLGEYREEAEWELVADRARSTGTEVERKGCVGCFGNPFFTQAVGADWMAEVGEFIGDVYW